MITTGFGKKKKKKKEMCIKSWIRISGEKKSNISLGIIIFKIL